MPQLYIIITIAITLAAALALAAILILRARRPKIPEPDATGMVRHLDVSYFDDASAHPVRHRLDVFVPGGARKLPVLLFVHGGGWSFGHKSDRTLGTYDKTGETFARLGMVVAMANYRLSPWVRHPEHARDVARALVWVRAHAADYGGDPNRIFIGGHSAGGHLAALVATDPTYLAEHGLSPAVLKGCIAISAVFRIGDFVRALARIPVVRFFGAMGPVFGDDPEARRQASPLTHVSSRMPPFLVLYAESEWYRLGEQAREFIDASAKAKAQVVAEQIPKRNHVTIISRARRPEDPVVRAVSAFIGAHK